MRDSLARLAEDKRAPRPRFADLFEERITVASIVDRPPHGSRGANGRSIRVGCVHTLAAGSYQLVGSGDEDVASCDRFHTPVVQGPDLQQKRVVAFGDRMTRKVQ